MSQKKFKKMKQYYRRELRDELDHVKNEKRGEAQILLDHLNLCVANKPFLIPKFVWIRIIKFTLYR